MVVVKRSFYATAKFNVGARESGCANQFRRFEPDLHAVIFPLSTQQTPQLSSSILKLQGANLPGPCTAWRLKEITSNVTPSTRNTKQSNKCGEGRCSSGEEKRAIKQRKAARVSVPLMDGTVHDTHQS